MGLQPPDQVLFSLCALVVREVGGGRLRMNNGILVELELLKFYTKLRHYFASVYL